MKAKYFDLLANAGRFGDLATKIVKLAKKLGLTDDEFAKLFGEEGEAALEQMLLSLKTPAQPAKAKPVQTVTDIVELEVDYVTPLEDQFAALAAAGKIRGDWRKGLNSQNYPPLRMGKQKIRLCERRFYQNFKNGTEVRAAIAGNAGEHTADPYMFVAWLRYNSDAGLKYPIAALGQLRSDADGCQYAPYASEIDGTRDVNDYWFDLGWIDRFWFLVSCE